MLSKILMCCGAGMTMSVAGEEVFETLSHIAKMHTGATLTFAASDDSQSSHYDTDDTNLYMWESSYGDEYYQDEYVIMDDDVVDPECPNIWADDLHQPAVIPAHRPNWYTSCAFKLGPHSSATIMQCNNGTCWDISHGHPKSNNRNWNWGVCKDQGKRMICPGIKPLMCGRPFTCDYGDADLDDEDKDFCCEVDCGAEPLVDIEIHQDITITLIGGSSVAVHDTLESYGRWCDAPALESSGGCSILGGLRHCEYGLCNSPECAEKEGTLVPDRQNYVNDCECWSQDWDYGYLTCQNGEEIRIACDEDGNNCTTPMNQWCLDEDHPQCVYFDPEELPRSEEGSSILWSFCNDRGHRAACPYTHKEMCGNPNECSPTFIINPLWDEETNIEKVLTLQDRYIAVPGTEQDHCCAWECTMEDGGVRECPVYVVPFENHYESLADMTDPQGAYVLGLGTIVWGESDANQTILEQIYLSQQGAGEAFLGCAGNEDNDSLQHCLREAFWTMTVNIHCFQYPDNLWCKTQFDTIN